MKRVCFFTLGLLIMAMGCQTNQKLTEQQKESILKAVKERSHEFWIVSNQKSYDKMTLNRFMSFVDEKSDQAWSTDPAGWVFNLEILKSRSDLENDFRKIFEARIVTSPIIKESYFAVLSKDLVLEVNKGDYTITRKDSTTLGPLTMVNTCVWMNSEGEWKMIHCHESYQPKKEK